jgi:hypothetical protein
MGLLACTAEVENALAELQRAGFPVQAVQVLSSTHDLQQSMDCSHHHTIFKDAAVGAGLIGLVYGIFGISAAASAVANGVPALWSAGAAAMFLLIGLGLGAFGGAFIGRAEAEKDTHLYVEGVRRGGALMLVWVEEGRATEAMGLLRQAHALGVRTCTRARQPISLEGLSRPI